MTFFDAYKEGLFNLNTGFIADIIGEIW